jgi:hypothetical protein
MAEQEVVKHSRKVYRIWKGPGNWKRKLGEFAVEILVIVFAISLSLFLERWREHKHEDAVAKDFLIGLRQDIESDIDGFKNGIESYQKTKTAFSFFLRQINSKDSIPQDSIKAHYSWVFFATSHFSGNNSRFDGLKSSGQLYYIRNKKLLNNILTLYQENLPWLYTIMNNYISFKREKLFDYHDTHMPVNGTNSEKLKKLIDDPVIQRYLKRGILVDQMMEEGEKCVALMKTIINQIDEEIK